MSTPGGRPSGRRTGLTWADDWTVADPRPRGPEPGATRALPTFHHRTPSAGGQPAPRTRRGRGQRPGPGVARPAVARAGTGAPRRDRTVRVHAHRAQP